MITIVEKKDCCGCEACNNACHANAISMKRDEEGFSYPIVDINKCIDCGLCDRVCPVKNTSKYSKQKITIAIAAKSKDKTLRVVSSSGGVFSVLAEEVINNNGIVFGVSMSDDATEAIHLKVDNINDLYKLRGSKYLQSRISETYCNVQEYLKNGKYVLFSGTPCQIAGLKLFLNKEYDNLLCVDVICHGVPSISVWEKYIEYIKKKYSGFIKIVSFRSKTEGWMEFDHENDVKDNKSIYIPKYEDIFLRLFLSDSCLRPSCYSCVSKDYGYLSDISLGDFWAIERVDASFNDGIGTSLVIVHSNKGERIIKKISDKLIMRKEPYEASIQGNSVIEQTKKPKNRDSFFYDLEQWTIQKIADKYAPISFKTKTKILLHRLGLLEIAKKFTRGTNAMADYGMKVIIS